jgi:arylsulfatase A-like enzyme
MSSDDIGDKLNLKKDALNRRAILLGSTTFAAASAIATSNPVQVAQAQQQPAAPSGKKPNILVVFGDDIGQSNISAYTFGLMGYRTPNIDRIAKEGLMFTDYYAEQSCTAGRSSFITGQSVIRTGMSKVGIPGATVGLQPEDITIAEALKPLGYATGQFGKNHLGDRNEYLPTGDTNVNDRLLQGWKIGDRTYRVHIDGYNQLPYLTGQEDHSARRGFIYFDDDGQLVAIRFDNWKLVFFEQKTPGTLDIWGEPFTARRLPLFFNLRMDPYERAQITSNEYYAWTLHKGYLMLGAQAFAAAFVNSLKDYPPRQKPQSFNLDQIVKRLQKPAQSD